jgi:hypothetical protein
LPQVFRISSAEWLPPIFTLKLSAGRGATSASAPRAIKKTTALRMQVLSLMSARLRYRPFCRNDCEARVDDGEALLGDAVVFCAVSGCAVLGDRVTVCVGARPGDVVTCCGRSGCAFTPCAFVRMPPIPPLAALPPQFPQYPVQLPFLLQLIDPFDPEQE